MRRNDAHRIRTMCANFQSGKQTLPATKGYVQKYMCMKTVVNETPQLPCEMTPSGQWFERFMQGVFTYNCLPDTGSTKSILSWNVARKYGLYVDQSVVASLTTVSGSVMHVEGKVKLRPKFKGGCLNMKGKFVEVKMLVSSTLLNEVFLSWDTLIALGLVPAGFPAVDGVGPDRFQES